MRLIMPEKCPFCGSEISGGDDYTALYQCGAYLGIMHAPGMWEIRGHEGMCSDILFKRERERMEVAYGQSG